MRARMIVLAGATLGFLIHNRPPARLFMGDAGSYLLGYSLAVCSILATFAGGTLPRHAIAAPLCVLAVPLYDMVTVIVIRLRSGRSPFEGDRCHLSHRLVELGLSKVQAVLTIYLATAACGFPLTGTLRAPNEVEAVLPMIRSAPGPVLYVAKVRAEPLPFALPPKDGAYLKDRFRRSLLAADPSAR